MHRAQIRREPLRSTATKDTGWTCYCCDSVVFHVLSTKWNIIS